MHKRITLGSNFYPAKGEAARRQRNATDSWQRLPHVDLVDAQLERHPDRVELAGFRRVETIRRDSVDITGIRGRHNAAVAEVFDLLAREALAVGNELFGFANTDILMTPAMVETVLANAVEGCKAQVFSRMDFDGATGADATIMHQGQDLYVIDAAWWMQNRWRFRPYIIGGGLWDMTFTPILLCHAGGRLHNTQALIRHELHANSWSDSPLLDYNRFLTTLDSRYLGEWIAYSDQLTALRGAGADPMAEAALMERSFTLQTPTWRVRLARAARVVRAFAREWWVGIRRGKLRPPERRTTYAPVPQAA